MDAKLKNKSLKDFEKLKGIGVKEKVQLFYEFYQYSKGQKHSNYRIASKTGSGSNIVVIDPYTNIEQSCISFVSNDYLGFTKHPKIIKAGIEALNIFGSGASSSPLIGGQSILH